MPHCVRQILLRLLDEAISRGAEQGHGWLDLECVPAEEGRFGLSVRIESASSSGASWSSLGPAIADRLVNLMGRTNLDA
jgi:hypothetical protein